MKKNKMIIQTSTFPASRETIWNKLSLLKTLQYVAYPYATFAPEKRSGDLKWNVGETSKFKMKLFGVIPFGTHSIHVVEFDKNTYTIYTNEINSFVPIWNHRITLKYLDKDKTLYTDEVEIDAGWKTNFVYLWGVLFYKHRQRKWRRLLFHV